MAAYLQCEDTGRFLALSSGTCSVGQDMWWRPAAAASGVLSSLYITCSSGSAAVHQWVQRERGHVRMGGEKFLSYSVLQWQVEASGVWGGKGLFAGSCCHSVTAKPARFICPLRQFQPFLLPPPHSFFQMGKIHIKTAARHASSFTTTNFMAQRSSSAVQQGQ